MINITLPKASEPGFPKRLYMAAGFQARISKNDLSQEFVLELIEYLSEYLTDPVEKEAAKTDIMTSPIWEATRDQWLEMISAIMGGGLSEGGDPLQEVKPEPTQKP